MEDQDSLQRWIWNITWVLTAGNHHYALLQVRYINFSKTYYKNMIDGSTIHYGAKWHFTINYHKRDNDNDVIVYQ